MGTRLEEIKKRMQASQLPTPPVASTAASQGSTGGSRVREIKRKMVADVDDKYIQSFLSDSRDHITNAQREYEGLTWQNTRSEEANVARANASANMNQRARKVRTYLDAYKDDIPEEQHTALTKYLDDFDAFQNQSAASFRNAYAQFSQFETEDDYNNRRERDFSDEEKYSTMSSEEIKRLGKLSTSQEDKGIITELRLTTMPYSREYARQDGREMATYDDIEKKRQYISQKYGIQFTGDVNENDQLLASLLQEPEVAYSTADGRNVTWDQLYRNALRSEDLASRLEAYSQNTDWADHSKGIEQVSDTESDFQIAFTLSRTTMPYNWETAQANGVDRADFDAIQQKRQYIGEKYGIDFEHDPYGSGTKALDDLVNKLQQDDSEKDSFDYFSYMTSDEKSVLNYIYNTQGRAAALDWHHSRRDIYQDRYNRSVTEGMKDLGETSPFWGSVGSLALSLGSGIEYAADAIDHAVTGETQYNTMANAANAIRTGVMERVDWEIGNWDAFDFLYGTGMSMAESGAANVLLGNLGGVALGLSAAAQATNDALDRGMTQKQAFWNGLVSGVFEGLFETLSIGQFNALKEVVSAHGRDIAKNIAKSMLVNASDETLTEAANIAHDWIMNGDFSQYETTIRQLMDSGDSESEAKRKSALSLGQQVAESGVSGLLMGLGFGATGSGRAIVGNAVTAAQDAARTRSISKEILDADSADILLKLAYEMAGASSPKMQSRLTKQAGAVENKATVGSVGRLYSTLKGASSIQNQSDVAKSLERKGFGSKDADSIAGAMVALSEGKVLTDKQTKLLETYAENNHVRSAFENIVLNKASTMSQRNQSLQSVTMQADLGAALRRAKKNTKRGTQSEIAGAQQDNAPNTDITATPEGIGSAAHYEASTDGRTIQKSTGEAVTLREIASVKDGKMTFRTESGAEVDAEDVSFGSEDEALVYEAVAGLCDNAKAANVLVGAFHTADIPGYVYASGIREAYTYGRFNISTKDMMRRGSFAKELTEHQRNTAYRIGQMFSEEQTSREVSAIHQRKKTGQKAEGMVHFDGDKSKLNDTQRAGLEAMELLAKGLGIQFYVYESEVDAAGNRLGENGRYFSSDGSIHIDLYAGNDGKGTILFTVAHELTHFIRQWSPAKFKILSNYLMEQYGNRDISVDELVSAQIAKAKRAGEAIDWDTAWEEVVSDSMETILNSGNVLQMMADMKEQDKTLWQKIRDWFKDFAEKLRRIVSAYGDVKPDSVEGKFVSELQDAIVILESLYGDALLDASDNFDGGTQKNTAEGGAGNNSAIKRSERIVDQIQRSLGKIMSLNSVYKINSSNATPFSADKKTDEKSGHAVFKSQGSVANRPGFGRVVLGKKGIVDTVFHGNGPAKQATFPAIKSVIENGIEIGRDYNHKGKGFDTVTFAAPIDFFNTKAPLGVVVKVFDNGRGDKSFYIHEICDAEGNYIELVDGVPVKKEISSTGLVDSSSTAGTADSGITPKNSIRNPDGNVNEKFSVRDSAGNQLSEAQQEYFRASKVRDKNGNLMVMYHGTPNGGFTKFRSGSYFTQNREYAAVYQSPNASMLSAKRSADNPQNYEVYLNITKPFDTRNPKERKIFMTEYYRQYGTGAPLCDSGLPDWTDGMDLQEFIEEMGYDYDGLILDEGAVGGYGDEVKSRGLSYVTFNSEQVKNISNQNPTDNPHIHLSSRDPAQQKIQQALEQENAQLKADVARFEELLRLQRTVTGGTKFTKTSVEAAARLLKKHANAKGDTKELAQLLHTFYETVASDKKPSWDKIKAAAQPVVQWLQDHVDIKEERSEYAQTILDQMRGSRIYLDESQRAEAAHRFGGYNDFRKALFGRITLVAEGETSLDSWWQEMADQFPDVFHPDTTSTDMPGELFDIIDQLKNADTSRVEYEYNRASIAMDLTRQVYDSYWRVSTMYTVADKAQAKINELKYKHYKQMTELRAEKNAKIDQIKAENRAVRERNVDSRRRTEARHKILRVARELDTLLRREDKKHHVPDSMKKAVAAALDLLELDTVNAAERIAKYDALIAQATDPDIIDSLMLSRDHIREQGEKIGARLKELHTAYADIMSSTDPDISAGYDPVIDGNLKELVETIGDTPFSKLSIEQLEDVYNMYKMVLTRIRDANKSFIDAKNATISQRSLAVIRQIRAVGGSHKYILGSGKSNAFAWNNLKPIYAIEKLGSPALKEAFWSLVEAEGGYARNIKEASEFAEKMRSDYGYDKWDMKKKYSFTSTSGIQFDLTLEQIMSLYAFSRREQALDHLRIGGFVFGNDIETYKVTEEVDPETGETKQRRSILKYRVNTADAHQLSETILTDIISVLDPKQAEFVEKMQGYLSDTMGAKGNEVSMAMYGIKLFKEKHYWPLKSSNSYMFQQNETAGEVRIKNASFTQKTTPKANNPIILQNFMDVWAGHVHDMSMYHSFTLPLEDFNRIFNFTTPRKEGQDPAGVKMTIQNAYGKEAVDYVRQMIVDLNGGARSDTREGMSKKLMGRFKKAAVAGSLSVAIQQPSALNRAKALIPDKYFMTLNPRLLSTGKLWEECKTYAPVAVIKEMGKFDMDTGTGTINYIKAEKKGIMDVVDDVTGWLPAKADEWTWVQIWAAVKKETAAIHPELVAGSNPFLEVAGKRFTEVIVKTQVYDSTLSRSGFMRSKGGLLQMTTAFMAEPTTSINMIEHAIWQAKRGYRKASLKTCRAILDSVIANAVLVSLVYALRDDDEDETFAEKYFGALTTEVIDGLNPLTYIPWVKDVWSLLQGFDVERSDMSLFADIADSLTIFGKLCAKDTDSMNDKELTAHKQKMVTASFNLVDYVANFFGLPVRNVRREIMAAINTYKNAQSNKKNGIITNARSFWAEVEECMRDTVPVLGWFSDSKSDQVYDALAAGDTAQINRLMNTYRGEDGSFKKSAYHAAVRKGLRENDPRIRQAAKAKLSGDHTAANRLLSQITAEGHFSRSDIAAAITAEYKHLKGD